MSEPNKVAESTELAERPKVVEPPDPYKGRKEAVDALTMAAYGKASTLVLTAEEVTKLQADFPDEAFRKGASGKDNLIYIEHAFLRDRMNEVFGPGQWAIVPRNRWSDERTTAKGKSAVKVYVEAMLLIRGCFVAEAVGDMDYWPDNESTNFGDAVEGAKTAALRRCTKELGIGLQAFKKSWCEEWWKRHPDGRALPAPAGSPLTEEQIEAVNKLLDECRKVYNPDFRLFVEWAANKKLPKDATPSLEDIPASRFDTIKFFLESKLAQLNKEKKNAAAT